MPGRMTTDVRDDHEYGRAREMTSHRLPESLTMDVGPNG